MFGQRPLSFPSSSNPILVDRGLSCELREKLEAIEVLRASADGGYGW